MLLYRISFILDVGQISVAVIYGKPSQHVSSPSGVSLEADLAAKERRWSSRAWIFPPSTIPILRESREAGGDVATLWRMYADSVMKN